MKFRRLFALILLISLFATVVPSAAQQLTKCETGFHLFENDYLATDPICVPDQPQRIAAVDTFTLETLLALGIKPVSGPFLETFLRDHPQYTEQLDGVTEIGWPVSPEALVEAHPDLIISIQPWIAETYADIAKIAPTVSIKYESDGEWQKIVRAVAAAVNQTQAIDAAFAGYSARLKAFHELSATAAVGDVSVIFLLPDMLVPFLSDTFSGEIALEAGLKFPAALVTAAADGTLTDISLERLDLLMSSDHIYVVTSGFTEEDLDAYKKLIADLEANVLWQALPATKAGHVHIVGRDWIGSSLIAANTVIDDLITGIAGVVPAEVAPNPFLLTDK